MQQVLNYIAENETRYLEELKRFIAIPSVSTLTKHREDVRRCAGWIAAHLESIGLAHVKVYPTEGNPIVFAEHMDSTDKPTLLLYGHYDVQPVEPLEEWTSPPFEATVRNRRLYGRGTADDKGQVFIHFKAMEAFLRTTRSLPVNLKVIVEGEEESGGGHLLQFLQTNKEILHSDVAVISDTPFFAKDVPSICYGMRGITGIQLEVLGPNRDLHSGVYGGSILNPIQALSEIIAAFHDGNGRVTIPGFYDSVRPITQVERETFRKLPWEDERYAQDLGVPCLQGEAGFTTQERIWTRPTLECNGIWGGFAGEGIKTVIPSRASAKISMRLVPDQDPETIAHDFAEHVHAIAPKSVTVEISRLATASPAITPIDSPGIQAALTALDRTFGTRPLFHRDGGTIPVVADLKNILGIETVLLGFGLPDENAHAPDEFIDLDHFFQGIRTVAVFYKEVAERMARPPSSSATQEIFRTR